MTQQDLERAVCAVICRGKGLRAREIAAELKLDHKTVNRVLYGSPLMKELCWQDRDFRWHGLVRQARPHAGLEEFAGWYGTAADFATLSEAEWMAQLAKGCGDIGCGICGRCWAMSALPGSWPLNCGSNGHGRCAFTRMCW